jgi:hypothetical protein
MKKYGVILFLWIGIMQTSDKEDTRASDFFRTLIAEGGFEQTAVITGASYVSEENKIRVSCHDSKGNTNFIEHRQPSGSPCYFERLCLFCNEKLKGGAVISFKDILRWGPKDRGEDCFRKQDSLLKALCDAWSLYNRHN